MKTVILSEKRSISKSIADMLTNFENQSFTIGKLNQFESDEYILTHLNSICLDSQYVYDLNQDLKPGKTFGINIDKNEMTKNGTLITKTLSPDKEISFVLSKESIVNASKVIKNQSLIIGVFDPSDEGLELFNYFLKTESFDTSPTLILKINNLTQNELLNSWKEIKPSIKNLSKRK